SRSILFVFTPIYMGQPCLWTYLEFGAATNFFDGSKIWPEGYQPNLMRTYLYWATLITALYYPCKKYLNKKKESESSIYSYV
ncbi:hypothetical protein MO867_14350, partial [Microbulbifer sp. OS29]